MRIVLAVDGSQVSNDATQVVANLPWPEKPDVTIVTALQESPHDLVPTEASTQIDKAEHEEASAAFEAASMILKPICASVENIIEHAHPRRLIMEVARDRDADLIVLGTTGHSAAYRVVIGSTADYVANHAKCSVLVIREAKETGLIEAYTYRLVAAYDSSDEAKEAYRQLASFEWPKRSTNLHLTTMLEKPKLLPDDAVYDADQIRACEDRLKELHADDEICDSVNYQVHETQHIGAALRDVAAEQKANLMFLGGTGKSAVARFFLGSISRFVLHHAPCSIWIARTRQWK